MNKAIFILVFATIAACSDKEDPAKASVTNKDGQTTVTPIAVQTPHPHPHPQPHPQPQSHDTIAHGILALFQMDALKGGNKLTGPDMPWQETINLKWDSTFTKSIFSTNDTTTGYGKFHFYHVLHSTNNYLELDFTTAGEISEDCQSTTQTLKIDSNGLFIGIAEACDRPQLSYHWAH